MGYGAEIETDVGAIAHPDGRDTEALDGVGVPPVGCAEVVDFLIESELLEKRWNRSIEECTRCRHGRKEGRHGCAS